MPSSSSKPSQFWTTYFLCLFLGCLGAHRFYTGKIKSGLFQLLTCGGLGIWSLVDMGTILIGKFRNKNGVAMPNASPKMTWAIFIIVMIVGFAGGGANSKTTSTSDRFHTSSSFDTDPSGIWIAGDQSSVYSRLEIDPGGTFAFQTVDFTGDVKGGYSGTWEANGNSLRFEWGSGIADSGSCSGRKVGANRLVFGSTTFHR